MYTVKQKNLRTVLKVNAGNNHYSCPDLTNIGNISKWVNSPDYDLYLGFGGLGDALLVLSACWNNPKAKVIFFVNNSSIKLVTDFFAVFNVSALIYKNIMGTRLAGMVYDMITKGSNFKTSGHLADGLNFNDWRNEKKYIDRIVNHANWIEYFGKEDTKDKISIIAPHGSISGYYKQRHIEKYEYNKLVNILAAEGYTVYGIGSENNYYTYGTPNKKSNWLTSNKKYSHNNDFSTISIKQMLRIINSASVIYSTDTWLKTYTLLAGMPTNVIMTRWNGNYFPYGHDISDWIFLNSKIWPHISLNKIEDILKPVLRRL
jgi:hypothetical protein